MSTSLRFSHLFATSFESSYTHSQLDIDTSFEDFATEIAERNAELSFVCDDFVGKDTTFNLFDSSSDVPLWTRSFFDCTVDDLEEASISVYSTESAATEQQELFDNSFSVYSTDSADLFDIENQRGVEFAAHHPSPTYFLFPLNVDPKNLEEEVAPVKKEAKVLKTITNLAGKLVGRKQISKQVLDKQTIKVIPNEYLWR